MLRPIDPDVGSLVLVDGEGSSFRGFVDGVMAYAIGDGWDGAGLDGVRGPDGALALAVDYLESLAAPEQSLEVFANCLWLYPNPSNETE